MCDRYGLTYTEIEEYYRSKASFLDKDEMPVYNADNPTEYSFSVSIQLARIQHSAFKGTRLIKVSS